MNSSDTEARHAVRVAAAELAHAERTAIPCDPVRPLVGADLSRGYEVQHALTEQSVVRGRRVVGRKIGLTNVEAQQSLGTDRPSYGVLFADMAVADEVPPGRLIQPRVEPEVAFVLAENLDGPDIDLRRLCAAIGHVTAAIEIVDSRIRPWPATAVDVVADNACGGMFALGDRRVPVQGLAVPKIAVQFTDGTATATGSASACLGNPLVGLLWLARTSAAEGVPLRAADIVLSGGITPPVAAAPGGRFRATFSHGLGHVDVRFGL